MGKKVHVIGSGVAGLAAASLLAQKGFETHLCEKNEQCGGRLSSWEMNGFRFDMGPSWYWMPEVFEDFFRKMGTCVDEHYELIRLDPSYRVFFDQANIVDVPASYKDLCELFESMESGAAHNLDRYMKEAAYKYEVGMNEFVWKPSKSIRDFMEWRILRSITKLDMLKSMSKHVRKYFKDPRLRQIMEFPVLFLGAEPSKTPALYSLMNYADLKLGTWYPMGGMHQIAHAMTNIARKAGVHIHTSVEVEKILTKSKNRVSGIRIQGIEQETDAIVAAADYHHVDQVLLPKESRQYSATYWESRKMAPSSLLFYVGLSAAIPNLRHHNLFFDESFDDHARTIYQTGEWPEKPMFYACVPSRTDSTVAPAGKENVFFLVPLAPGLEDRPEERERLFDYISDKIRTFTGVDIKPLIECKRSFAMKDFESRYHSFKGNAYGLANTLRQTAFLKPALHHKQLKNLVFAGQLTVPGPGLPPSIISGQIAAQELSLILDS